MTTLILDLDGAPAQCRAFFSHPAIVGKNRSWASRKFKRIKRIFTRHPASVEDLRSIMAERRAPLIRRVLLKAGSEGRTEIVGVEAPGL